MNCPALFHEIQAAADHELKVWSDPFQELWDGRKTNETRLDDRNFQVGDSLFLREFRLSSGTYTLRWIYSIISHIQAGFGLGQGYVALSLSAEQTHKGIGDEPVFDGQKNDVNLDGLWRHYRGGHYIAAGRVLCLDSMANDVEAVTQAQVAGSDGGQVVLCRCPEIRGLFFVSEGLADEYGRDWVLYWSSGLIPWFVRPLASWNEVIESGRPRFLKV